MFRTLKLTQSHFGLLCITFVSGRHTARSKWKISQDVCKHRFCTSEMKLICIPRLGAGKSSVTCLSHSLLFSLSNIKLIVLLVWSKTAVLFADSLKLKLKAYESIKAFIAGPAHALRAQRQISAKDFPSACTKTKARFTKSPQSSALCLFSVGILLC